jgi:tetratricopeptide (TPR) repeat protein
VADDPRATTVPASALSTPVQSTLDDGGESAVAAASRPAPRRIGRYEIVRRLGAGGMGVVWEAVDPELDRGVAIKVLHDAGGARHADRLRREAQALARLSSPNVVAVYDVGVADGELFVVMQLVAGVTLDRALAERALRPPEIVELLVQAGRGLVAAHAAGIVHRDFKPGNVLVDRDGAVRVSDFGLSRATEDAAQTTPKGTALDVSMTRGDIVGTPAYMAPEQFRGGPITHATDQFSFCVTLWEALCGERPFAGEDVTTIRDAVLAGRRRDTNDPRLSRRARRVLERGLATDPVDRFPSMAALLATLAPRRRRAWIGGAVLVGAAASLAIFGMSRSTGGDPCADASRPADAVWNPARANAVRAAIAKRDVQLADAIVERFDLRAARWKAARLETCRATRARGDQPETVLVARELCLDRSLADERAAIELLSGPIDVELATRAKEVAAAGVDPDDCSHARLAKLGAGSAASPDLLAIGARLSALNTAGRYREAVALHATSGALIDRSGDPALVTNWYWALAQAYRQLGDLAASKAAVRKSAETAASAGDDDGAARAWGTLAEYAAEAKELKGVDDLLAMTRAAAARANDPRTPVWADLASGRVAIERGAYAEAETACKRALDVVGTLDPFAIEAWSCLYDARSSAGDTAGALAAALKSAELATRVYGPDHPITLGAVRGVAGAMTRVGDRVGAASAWERVLAGFEKLYGPDSVPVMETLRDRALADTPGGVSSTPEALAAITRAAAIADKILDAKDPRRAGMFEALAYVEGALGHVDAENAAYVRAIAAFEQLDDPLGLARVLFGAAAPLREHGHCDRAIPLLKRAIKVAQDSGQRTQVAAASLGALGQCLGAAKQWSEAEAALVEAIAAHDADGDHLFGAQDRWELADQLVKRGQRERGLGYARAAAAELVGKPPPAEELRKQILEWIAAR